MDPGEGVGTAQKLRVVERGAVGRCDDGVDGGSGEWKVGRCVGVNDDAASVGAAARSGAVGVKRWEGQTGGIGNRRNF